MKNQREKGLLLNKRPQLLLVAWHGLLQWFLLIMSCSVFAGQSLPENATQSRLSLISTPLEPIKFQLRWHHQMQFAGYYAAKEKGFYEQAGFDVTLVSGTPGRQPVTEVLAGRAQYAVGNSEVLYSRLVGQPLVALAAIYQHSPSVLLTLKKSGIKTPADLVGRRVMAVGSEGDAIFLAMFNAAGVDVNQIELIDSSYQINDLITEKTDAFNSYLTNEPFYLEEQGLEYNVIKPRDYGIDFYSDILFTSEKEVRNNPGRVKRFKQATLQGWNYALSHPEEIITIIREKYSDKKSLNHMRFEAVSMMQLIMPELVEVGYINFQRFQTMAEVFKQEGMVDDTSGLNEFVFTAADELPDEMYSLLIAIAIFLVAALLVALILALFNHRLQNEIQERKAVEEKLKSLADTDPLTQLLNRRAFSKRYQEELFRAQRYHDLFSIILIDLDLFKNINDHHGHEAGDRVLVSIANLLSEGTRNSDVCCRFGGEEFILLMPKTQLLEAKNYASRLCQHIRNNEVVLKSGKSASVTASIGVAQWQNKEEGELTISRADKALYTAKSRGRDQVVALDYEQVLGE